MVWQFLKALVILAGLALGVNLVLFLVSVILPWRVLTFVACMGMGYMLVQVVRDSRATRHGGGY